jgi:FAD/FMN-containing dehydrogenase
MHFSTLYLSGLLASAALATTNVSASTCASLLSITDNVLFPTSPKYNTSVMSYPFIQLRLQPTCIFRPKTAHDVSEAVKLLKKTKGVKFAVKGGGHNANTGFNNIEDGVTIDMGEMNAVNITEGGVVRVGAGAIWQDVYDVVEPKNLTVLGGRIGVVGVGGFLTGGMFLNFKPFTKKRE